MHNLSASRARAFDHLFDAVLVINHAGRITDINHAAESLTGRQRPDWVGRPLDDFFTDGSPALEREAVNATFRLDGRWRGENSIRSPDGTLIEVDTQMIPLFDEHGRLNGALCINRDISRHRRQEQKLVELAHTDQVTGLANRALLLDRLKQMLAQNRRTGQTLALLFLDMDGFKQVNDLAGHTVGDKVLRAVGHRMQRVLRENDTLARWGGDEFTALLADVSAPANAERVAEKLLQTFTWPVSVGGHQHHLSVSIGIALSPDHGQDVDVLLNLADSAMYQAKAAGGQSFSVVAGRSAESAA